MTTEPRVLFLTSGQTCSQNSMQGCSFKQKVKFSSDTLRQANERPRGHKLFTVCSCQVLSARCCTDFPPYTTASFLVKKKAPQIVTLNILTFCFFYIHLFQRRKSRYAELDFEVPVASFLYQLLSIVLDKAIHFHVCTFVLSCYSCTEDHAHEKAPPGHVPGSEQKIAAC